MANKISNKKIILPFPVPLHVGTDICRISRIQGILAGERGARFIRRVLTPEELVRPRRCVERVLRREDLKGLGKGTIGRGAVAGDGDVKVGDADRGSNDGVGEGRVSTLGEDEEMRDVREAAVFMAGR